MFFALAAVAHKRKTVLLQQLWLQQGGLDTLLASASRHALGLESTITGHGCSISVDGVFCYIVLPFLQGCGAGVAAQSLN